MPLKSRRGSSRKTRGVTPIRYRTETDSESDETPQPSTSAKPSFEEIILERLDNLQSEVNSLKRNRNDDSQSEARLTHTSKRKRNNKSVESAPRSTTKSHQTPSRESSPSPSLQSNPISMSDSDSDMEDDFDYSPTASFGSTIGSVVTSKLKSKILAGKFVEMSDLLTRTNLKSSQEEYHMRPGKNNYSKFVKNQNVRNLPFSLWTKAFDVFISIYLERATTRDAILREAKHLLTYKEIVSRLMRTGHDWQNYDRHFRLEHEGNPMPWNTTRHDLMLEYQASSNNESQRPFRQQQHSSAKKLKTKDGAFIPVGYCTTYHSRNTHCTQKPCGYSHICPSCSLRHPVFACNKQSKTTTPGGAPQSKWNWQKFRQNNYPSQLPKTSVLSDQNKIWQTFDTIFSIRVPRWF